MTATMPFGPARSAASDLLLANDALKSASLVPLDDEPAERVAVVAAYVAELILAAVVLQQKLQLLLEPTR